MADVLKLDPMQKRQLEGELSQLQSDGYAREDLIDYARGFKDGYADTGLGGAMGKVAQGALLESGDELKGVIQSKVLNTGKSRLFETARARGQLARMGREHPIASPLLEIAGSIPTSVSAGKGISKLMPGGPSKTMLGKMREGAIGGATAGSLAGAGSAVGGLDERTINGILGGLGGGIIGSLAVPVVETLAAGGRYLGGMFSPKYADTQAKAAFGQAIEEGPGQPGIAGIITTPTGPGPPPDVLRQPTAPAAGFSPDDYATLVAGRMREAQAGGTPFTMGEAIGPGGVGLLETAAQAPGKTKVAAEIGLGDRQQRQPRRLIDALRRTSGVTEGSVDQILATKAARSAAAKPNYRALETVDAPDDVMREVWGFMQTDAGKDAYDKAAQAAQQAKYRGDPGGSLPSFEAIMQGARLTAGEADTLLQGLETFAEKKMITSPVPGKLFESKESFPFSESARKLRKVMADRIPEFEKARSEYKAPSDFINAIEIGDKVRNMDMDTFKTYWRDLNASQQEGTKIGLINDLKAQLEDFVRGPTANAARLLSKKESLRDKLAIAMGNSSDDLLKVADVENLTSENVNRILGNSRTAGREAGAKALDEPLQKIPTGPASATAQFLGWLDEATKRKVREAIGRLGLTANPDQAEAIVREIMKPKPSARAPKTGAVVGAPAGFIIPTLRDAYGTP